VSSVSIIASESLAKENIRKHNSKEFYKVSCRLFTLEPIENYIKESCRLFTLEPIENYIKESCRLFTLEPIKL
jgi:hypothetical protein